MLACQLIWFRVHSAGQYPNIDMDNGADGHEVTAWLKAENRTHNAPKNTQTKALFGFICQLHLWSLNFCVCDETEVATDLPYCDVLLNTVFAYPKRRNVQRGFLSIG